MAPSFEAAPLQSRACSGSRWNGAGCIGGASHGTSLALSGLPVFQTPSGPDTR